MTNSSAVEATEVVLWIFLPAFFGFLFYVTLSMFVYPYARPLVPFWLILFAIFIPPFFPLLFFYVVLAVCLWPRPPTPTLVVIETTQPPPRRATIVQSSPARFSSSSRV